MGPGLHPLVIDTWCKLTPPLPLGLLTSAGLQGKLWEADRSLRLSLGGH